ncbi:hypothetical protein [Magnetospirillum sulfuroxidans]|uniref:Uncharacterized protein n=1 Tax=Magnetospirillum sulfuroxidans TaxID=611300 RepID=A0ABS5IAT1_9PROT|nr:hypothetical protein [Magnetospirillum sulfuroxidans]MBR9971371.1 hypothetical protein [Magnetospirillum sulfuroxidans]
MTDRFADHLIAATRIHANEIHLRGDDDVFRLVAMVRGDAVLMAELSPAQAADFLADAFALCDDGDCYQPGAARMMRLTGERLALPAELSQALVQFLPPRDGGRQLVARLSYAGDVCCGSCGGG